MSIWLLYECENYADLKMIFEAIFSFHLSSLCLLPKASMEAIGCIKLFNTIVHWLFFIKSNVFNVWIFWVLSVHWL